jgi:hypothetical protein
VRDQVSHPYKTTGEIVVPYIFLFIFFDRKLEDKDLHRITARIPQFQSALDSFKKGILIRYGFSQMLELFHLFKQATAYIYVVIL